MSDWIDFGEDLRIPFIFVPHGQPESSEVTAFKARYPDWLSIPATFVPHSETRLRANEASLPEYVERTPPLHEEASLPPPPITDRRLLRQGEAGSSLRCFPKGECAAWRPGGRVAGIARLARDVRGRSARRRIAMTKAQFRDARESIDLPGIDGNFLIEPEFLASRQWGICCIPDRLTFHQIGILIGPDSDQSSRIFGAFSTLCEIRALHLDRTVSNVGAFFAEMVGGNACIFDLPTSFLISVLEGDITLIATSHANLQQIFGSQCEMTRSDWMRIAKEVRQDISDKLLGKYVATEE